MVRLRKIKKYGGSTVILLSSRDLADKKWKIGDMVDIDKLNGMKGGQENEEEKEV